MVSDRTLRNWIVFTFGRILAYLAVALAENAVPGYSAEISPVHVRGLFGGLLIVMNTFGGIWGSALSRGFVTETRKRGWLIPTGVQLIPGVLLIFLVPFCVESPRWLIQKGRLDEALVQLCRVRTKEDVAAGYPQEEIRLLGEATEQDMANNKVPWLRMFKGTYLPRSIVSILHCEHSRWDAESPRRRFVCCSSPTNGEEINFGPPMDPRKPSAAISFYDLR